MRLPVPRASTEQAFVSTAGATIVVKTAKGLSVKGPIRIPKQPRRANEAHLQDAAGGGKDARSCAVEVDSHHSFAPMNVEVIDSPRA
jgi:hypothetical protein